MARLLVGHKIAARLLVPVLTAAVLLGILAVAFFVRLWNVGGIGLRGDEAVYAGQAAVMSGAGDMGRYFILISRGNSNFLLFQYVLSAFYFLFGVSDVGARIVSALFSTLTVLITFELGRTLYGRKVGLLAALFLALSSYSVALGRLALLDSPMTFFFALAMLCVAKWLRTQKQAWLLGFAAVSALAIQTKVTGGLVLPIFGIYLLITQQYRSLSIRNVMLSSTVFLAFLTPALLQLAHHRHEFVEFLSDSGGRVSHVPWYYYVSTVTNYEGYLIPAIWLLGLAFAIKKRTPGDVLSVLWIAVVVLFFQWHSLKAFNYLLPIVPALSLLAARAVGSLSLGSLGTARAGLLVAVFAGGSILPLNNVLHDDAYAGLREASYWLKSNTSPDAGVMTISRGSAQYVISYYANRDSYPFGRFRLATVLPGGVILEPRPAPEGAPTDWLSYWPPRLIGNRTVSYLVYYTYAGDDPPDEPIVRTSTQRQFRKLIEAYGGRLVHTVYRNHEPRVWVYQVGKLLPEEDITFSQEGEFLKVQGHGFLMNSQATISYHQATIGTYPTDENGSFSVTVPLPEGIRPSYYLRAVDEGGNYASSTGQHIWGVDETAQFANPFSIYLPLNLGSFH